jgi:hypothetical protein
MKITPDKAPINRQAAVQLSRGTGQVESVEEALGILGRSIASPEFAGCVRQMIEAGMNLKYELTIKKSNQPGFVVALNYHAETKKKQLGTFLRLL